MPLELPEIQVNPPTSSNGCWFATADDCFGCASDESSAIALLILAYLNEYEGVETLTINGEIVNVADLLKG